MHKDLFTAASTGVLLPLEGEVNTRYGVIPYRTFAFKPARLGEYPAMTPAWLGLLGAPRHR